MKKRTLLAKLLCIVLTVSLVLGVSPLKTAAASVQFSDVYEADYYYTQVTEMCRMGIVGGYGDGSFQPNNPVKNAEALKLVLSMAGVDYVGCSGKTEPWYSDVWAWAVDNSVISPDTEPEAFATRGQLCSYIVTVYKLPTDTDTDAFSDTHSKIANVLYDYGVISGIPNGDSTYSFGGSQNVKRCDTCVMLYRLNEKVTKPVWSEAFELDLSHYRVSKPASFGSFADYVKAWDYMLANTVFETSFSAGFSCTKTQLDGIMEKIRSAYYFAMFDYMEYASFLNQCSYGVNYRTDGKICSDIVFTLKLSNAGGLAQSQIKNEISAFTGACAKTVTALYDSGGLKPGMSDREKAYVLYVYTAYNMKYDESYKFNNGYDAAVRGTAVCMGYTAMYNYLCNLAGVRMECMTGYADGSGHAWSRIYSDGAYYNIDTTWSDPVPDRPNYCDDSWFWVTDNYLKTCSDPRSFDSDTLVYG